MSEPIKNRLLPHEPDYRPDAWRDYTAEELRWWVQLLRKRAGMRRDPAQAAQDRYDADNYEAMLRESEKGAGR